MNELIMVLVIMILLLILLAAIYHLKCHFYQKEIDYMERLAKEDRDYIRILEDRIVVYKNNREN